MLGSTFTHHLLRYASPLWIALLAGCAFLRPSPDPTRYYLLTDQPAKVGEATRPIGERLKLALQPLDLPAYLQGKVMIVRTAAHEIHFEDYHRWGEPLDQGISQVLRASVNRSSTLEMRLSNSRSLDPADYAVTVHILECEGMLFGSGAGSIRFSMSWEAKPIANHQLPTLRGVGPSSSTAWDGHDFGQLAARLAEAVTEAGTALATAMTSGVDAARLGKP